MDGDIKDIIGALMRVRGGGEISREEVEELTFDAPQELQPALNAAYIELMEFAYDREARLKDRKLDAEKRARLQACLDEIVRFCDRAIPSN